MEKETRKQDDIERNRPSDEGRDNDPHIRDEDARRPGVSTMSSTDNDASNEDLTETASDNFSEAPRDKHADTRFNEVDRDNSKD